MAKREITQFLLDIQESIEYIIVYTSGMNFEDFQNDRKTIDAVLRNLEIIGEASKNIPEDIREKYSDIDWRGMSGMRDKLIHNYFGINIEIVWKTITEILPKILKQFDDLKEKSS